METTITRTQAIALAEAVVIESGVNPASPKVQDFMRVIRTENRIARGTCVAYAANGDRICCPMMAAGYLTGDNWPETATALAFTWDTVTRKVVGVDTLILHLTGD